MSEGTTCYERDEMFCEDQMCLRTGCRLLNAKATEQHSSTGSASVPTPGPWVVGTQFAERHGGRTYIPILRPGNDPVPIAVVHRDVDGYGRGEGEANARLIAALPDLVKEIERLQALVNAQSTQWQPIETAPQDGTWILGWTLDDIDDDKWPRCSIVRWRTVGRTRSKGPGFYDDRVFHVCDLAFWMPLPEAPSVSSTDQAAP